MKTGLFLILAFALVAGAARADVVIPHVGRLMKAEGGQDVPVTGAQKLKFGLYKLNVDPSGQNSLVWEDTYDGVEFTGGLYHVDLGDKTPLTADDIAGQSTLWLEVSIFDGGNATKLLPRMRLEASSLAHFANDAAKLGGKAAADYVLKGDFDAFKSDLTGGSSGGITVPWAKITGAPARLQALLDGGLTEVTASGILSGKGTGEQPLTVAADSIGTALLKDGAVTKEKLAANAVTPDLFTANSIPPTKLVACSENQILKVQSGTWQCGADVGGGSTLPFGVLAPLEQISGSGSATLALKDAGIATVKLADGAVTGAKLANDAASLTKVTGGAAISDGLNLGLGVTTPTRRLEVAPLAMTDGVGLLTVNANSLQATITGGNLSTQVAVGDIVAFSSTGNRLVTAVTASSLTYAGPVLSTVNNNNNLSFKVGRPTAQLGSLNVANDGSVGIGTITPLAKLHVAGDLKVDGSRIMRKISVQTDTRDYSSGTGWTAGPAYNEIPGFKAGSLVKLTYHMPMRNDSGGWGGGYVEPQISFNNGSTWNSLGSSGYDGGVMNTGGGAIGSYFNTILVDPQQSTDYSVKVRFYFRSYDGTVYINTSHDLNTVSGTANIMTGVNGTQHYAKIIVEELY